MWLYYKLCHHVKSKIRLQMPKEAKKLTVVVALFFGTIVYKFLLKIFNYFVCKLHKMRTMSNFDDFFLSDDEKCICSGNLRL